MSRSEAEEILEETLYEYPHDIELEEHWREALLMLIGGEHVDQKTALEIILDALNWGNGDPLRLKLEPVVTMSPS